MNIKYTFLIALFVFTDFQVAVVGNSTQPDPLMNSTAENATIQNPSTSTTLSLINDVSVGIKEHSTQQAATILSTSTFEQLTDEPKFSTTTTTTVTTSEPASNLNPLPSTDLPSIPSSPTDNTAANDFSSWSQHPLSTQTEQTTPQITNRSELSTQQNSDTNSTANTILNGDADSTQTDPSLNTTYSSTLALKMGNLTTSDTPVISSNGTIEDEEIGTNTTTITESDLNINNTSEQSTNPPLLGTEMTVGENSTTNNASITENNVVEMDLNATSAPESNSTNGTSPSARNSTERFSDVDATPLLETASMTPSSSSSSLTSTAISSDRMTTKAETTSSSTPAPTPTQPATRKWFVLQFMGNCSEMEERFDDFKKQIHEKILSKAGIPDHQVTLNAINCTNSFLLNVSVSSESEVQLSRFFNNLETTTNSTNKFKISDKTYLMNVINSVGDSAYHQPPEVTLSSKHTDIEFVIYVALGSTCVFLLSLAVILVGCKYCRSKPYKSFDLNDISHLSLGLEDFTLTRIPRAKSTIYNDFGAAIGCKNQYSPIDQQQGGGNGMVHSYDTSVVPLEDAPNFKTENETEQQIVGKSTQTTPTNHEYEEIDVKAIKSTENLHSMPNAATKHWGVDNASFSTP